MAEEPLGFPKRLRGFGEKLVDDPAEGRIETTGASAVADQPDRLRFRLWPKPERIWIWAIRITSVPFSSQR